MTNWAIKVNRWMYKENLTRNEAVRIIQSIEKCVSGVRLVYIQAETEIDV